MGAALQCLQVVDLVLELRDAQLAVVKYLEALVPARQSLRGEIEDISQVVIAGQKAELALQLTLQVRNRAVSAYQELMRMQV